MEENKQREELVDNAKEFSKNNKNEEIKKINVDDVEKNKTMAILAYFIFFLPMLTDAKNSEFAMFHANQALVLMLTGVAVSIIGTIIPFLGWFLILPFGMLFVVILAIMGIINAANGKMNRLPIIGSIHILDK